MPTSHTATTSEAVISVRGLRRCYGPLVAVDGLDLDVHRGEVVALLGPNGAGKTTVVEILEGYRHRDSGQVQVLGADPAQADRAWRSRIGIVLQEVGDLGLLTVAEAVTHFARYYPHPADPEALIDLIGLTDRRRASAATLSGGQRRRLDVALGLVGRPELLFLDEPTTGLDPQARRQVWDMLAQLRAAGTTVVLTTHYLEEAEVLADRVGVIVNGRLVSLGPPAELAGRASRAARVRWVDTDGHVHEEVTLSPTQRVVALATATGGEPVELAELTVTRPTLEDVYLELVAASSPAGDATSARPDTYGPQPASEAEGSA
mgnify:CR=1 FL=1